MRQITQRLIWREKEYASCHKKTTAHDAQRGNICQLYSNDLLYWEFLKTKQNFTENGGRAPLGPTPNSTYASTRRAILILLKHA